MYRILLTPKLTLEISFLGVEYLRMMRFQDVDILRILLQQLRYFDVSGSDEISWGG